uniref:Uncharacterized protein n=1 Tax=Anopheles farauti TaxID=69004 RepID=A0A182Q0P6_9DIPT
MPPSTVDDSKPVYNRTPNRPHMTAVTGSRTLSRKTSNPVRNVSHLSSMRQTQHYHAKREKHRENNVHDYNITPADRTDASAFENHTTGRHNYQQRKVL